MRRCAFFRVSVVSLFVRGFLCEELLISSSFSCTGDVESSFSYRQFAESVPSRYGSSSLEVSGFRFPFSSSPGFDFSLTSLGSRLVRSQPSSAPFEVETEIVASDSSSVSSNVMLVSSHREGNRSSVSTTLSVAGSAITRVENGSTSPLCRNLSAASAVCELYELLEEGSDRRYDPFAVQRSFTFLSDPSKQYSAGGTGGQADGPFPKFSDPGEEIYSFPVSDNSYLRRVRMVNSGTFPPSLGDVECDLTMVVNFVVESRDLTLNFSEVPDLVLSLEGASPALNVYYSPEEDCLAYYCSHASGSGWCESVASDPVTGRPPCVEQSVLEQGLSMCRDGPGCIFLNAIGFGVEVPWPGRPLVGSDPLKVYLESAFLEEVNVTLTRMSDCVAQYSFQRVLHGGRGPKRFLWVLSRGGGFTYGGGSLRVGLLLLVLPTTAAATEHVWQLHEFCFGSSGGLPLLSATERGGGSDVRRP